MGSEATEVNRKEEEEKRGMKRERDVEEEELDEEGSKSTRPSRERKKVERYSAVSPRRSSASKSLLIEQGSGMKLRDIPNVVFKLSKRKADDSLQALHTILFGKKSKVHFLKKNILQFSGFVWAENEEKHKAKLKEKLDKYTKEKLIDFCGLLDVQFPKSTTKKEDVSAKLLEFLESPHVTRDLLLANKDKGKKRRSRTKSVEAAVEDSSLDKETKKRKKGAETKPNEGQKQSSKAEEEDEVSGGSDGASSGEEDKNDLEEESDHDKLEEIEGNELEKPLESTKNETADEIQPDAVDPEDEGRASPIKKAASVKSNKSPSKYSPKKTASPNEDETHVAIGSKHDSTKKKHDSTKKPTGKSSKGSDHDSTKEQTGKSSKAITKEKTASVKKEGKKKSSMKNAPADVSDPIPSKSSKSQKVDKKKGMGKEEAVVEGKKSRKKKEAKPAAKVSTKGQGKRKKNSGPSTEELHSVISSILKEVDFNTATMADILKQLELHFKMDLMDRKAEVKSIIEDVINNMTDDEEEEGDEDEGDLGGKEEENKSEEESD